MKTNLVDRTPLTPGTCEWCGKDCEVEDAACSLSCEARIAREEAVQGRAAVRILKRWRKHRGRKGTPGEGAMTEVATMIDKFLRSDRIRREALCAERRAEEARKVAEQKTDSTEPPPA